MEHRSFKKFIRATSLCLILSFLVTLVASAQSARDVSNAKAFQEMRQNKQNTKRSAGHQDTATFAAGCYWCVEAQYKELAGVDTVISGFIGGTVKNPTYEQVSKGSTGHAEACNIIYDPTKITYDELLAAFFVVHDPTQLNRQGDEVGTQYRSAIFYHNPKQKKLADYYINKLNQEKAYPTPIVTEVQPYTIFYKASEEDQDYYAKNGAAPYCKRVIQPKLENFQKVFKDKLKQ